MESVTLSPKYQVVIPKSVRESLGLTAGIKFKVIQLLDRIELIPEKPLKNFRGFLKGIKTDVPRDEDRV